MTIQVFFLPRDLGERDLSGHTVVVFDVLRATTTMAAALAAGVREIRVFDSIDSARGAAASFTGAKLLCGEVNCLPPAGFDLGNSPRDWVGADRGELTMFMATTNGTRAIAAAARLKPGRLLAGALVNARAAAGAIAGAEQVTLLCAGSNGAVSVEDILGAGAVISEAMQLGGCQLAGDAAQIAARVFDHARGNLTEVMRPGAGARNLIAAGLEADIAACAALNSLGAVGVLDFAAMSIGKL